MENRPTPKGDNGRDPTTGRFLPGYKGGPGNPFARRTADIRRTFLDAASDDDLVGIVNALVKRAKGEDVAAAKELLDRMLGKAKGTMAAETKSQLDMEEAKARLQAMLEGNPSLRQRLVEMVGTKVLPGDTSPNAVMVVD